MSCWNWDNNFDHLWSFLTIIDHLDHYWPFWPFWPFWPIWPFLIILIIWTIIDHLGHFWPIWDCSYNSILFFNSLIRHYNPEYNTQKHAAYGCNCNLLTGDRPMTQSGHGPPIDSLDAVCRSFKHCLQCVTKTHGTGCIGELILYDFSMPDGPVCHDDAGTCGRALCECDRQFAQAHSAQINVYNQNFNHIFAQFSPEEICRK